MSTDLTGRSQPTPLVSVVIATRDRGPSICTTLTSILGQSHQNLELIVFDQSDNDVTERAVAPFLADPRLRYIRSQTRGLSVARNLGLSAARSDIVAMTDDDCEAGPDWIRTIVDLFQTHPKVAMIFCSVVAGPMDPTKGLIPVFPFERDRLVKKVDPSVATGFGMGAGMALRRDVAQRLGGFDDMLGAGALFRTGEETDLAIRFVTHGYHIYQSSSAEVLHYGMRPFHERGGLVRGYTFGLGGAYAKLIKCGRWDMIPAYLSLFWSLIIKPSFMELTSGKIPRVYGLLTYLVKGLARGLALPVDPARQVYR